MQLDLTLDSRTSVVLQEAETQRTAREDIAKRIGPHIRAFCDLHCGQTVRGELLYEFVAMRVGKVALDSPRRIADKMDRAGEINYKALGKSLYRCGA